MKFSHDWMADTHPGALRVYLDLNHRMPPQQKFDRVIEMYETLVATYIEQERQARPGATEREVFLRAAARRLGASTVKRAYGWPPDE